MVEPSARKNNAVPEGGRFRTPDNVRKVEDTISGQNIPRRLCLGTEEEQVHRKVTSGMGSKWVVWNDMKMMNDKRQQNNEKYMIVSWKKTSFFSKKWQILFLWFFTTQDPGCLLHIPSVGRITYMEEGFSHPQVSTWDLDLTCRLGVSTQPQVRSGLRWGVPEKMQFTTNGV